MQMECQNGDETVWTRQIWRSQLVNVISLQSRIKAFQPLSQPNMCVQNRNLCQDSCFLSGHKNKNNQKSKFSCLIIIYVGHNSKIERGILGTWLEEVL